MRVYIVCDSEKRVLHASTSPFAEEYQEIEVDNYEVFESPDLFIYKDGTLEKDETKQLEKRKLAKDQELNQACNDAIMAGFDHVIDGLEYHFSFDTEAQLNFQGIRPLLAEGIVTQVDWTVSRDGAYHRIPVDKKLMDELTVAILMHKDGNVRKYRNVLLPKVYEATTIEEVDKINWNSI